MRFLRKGNLCALLVRVQIGAATIENIMEVPQKTKNRTTIWPEIPLLGIYPTTLTQKGIHTPMFNDHYSQKPRYGDNSRIRGWMGERNVTHTHTEICSVIGKGNLAVCDDRDGLRRHYSKGNEPHRERQIPYDLTYLWNVKHTENKL